MGTKKFPGIQLWLNLWMWDVVEPVCVNGAAPEEKVSLEGCFNHCNAQNDHHDDDQKWKWKQSRRMQYLVLRQFFKFRRNCLKMWTVGHQHLYHHAPHQPWGAPAPHEHLLPHLGSWGPGHPDHQHWGGRVESQTGNPARLTSSSPSWCPFSNIWSSSCCSSTLPSRSSCQGSKPSSGSSLSGYKSCCCCNCITFFHRCYGCWIRRSFSFLFCSSATTTASSAFTTSWSSKGDVCWEEGYAFIFPSQSGWLPSFSTTYFNSWICPICTISCSKRWSAANSRRCTSSSCFCGLGRSGGCLFSCSRRRLCSRVW